MIAGITSENMFVADQLTEWREDMSQGTSLTWRGVPVMKTHHEVLPRSYDEYAAIALIIRDLMIFQ